MAYSLTVAKLEAFSDIVEFERLCSDLLSTFPKYRFLEPQSVGRKDGGKDAVLCFYDGQDIVFHFSMRKDWERKLNEDGQKVKELDRDYNEFVFVTNRLISGIKKDNVKLTFESEYLMKLEIFDQERLRVELDNNRKDLRMKYLSIPESDDTSKKIDEMHEILQKMGKNLNFKILNKVIKEIIAINETKTEPLSKGLSIDIKKKLEINKFSTRFENFLIEQMPKFSEIDEFLRTGLVSGKEIEKMVSVLKLLYMKYRDPKKNGDEIFFAIHEELIPSQCTEEEYIAYSTLLCYFFQSCEVFEHVTPK